MSPRRRKGNLLMFRRIKTQPLPPLKAPPREPGVGLQLTIEEEREPESARRAPDDRGGTHYR